MGPELTKAVEEKMMGCHVSQVWGMSETTGSITIQPWDEKDDTGCISEIQPNTKMRIVDDEENDVPEGHPGEFLVQSKTVTPGYWENPTDTAESFTKCGTWFKTGDVGLRRNNKFYIVDRKKVTVELENSMKTLILTAQSAGTHQVQGPSGGSSRARSAASDPSFDHGRGCSRRASGRGRRQRGTPCIHCGRPGQGVRE